MPGSRSCRIHFTEKIVYLELYKGEEIIVKERFKKEYRHPDLDKKLAKRRINAEVKALDRARQLGVNTPLVKHSDTETRTIRLEYLKEYEASKYFLDRAVSDSSMMEEGRVASHQAKRFLGFIGQAIAKLHSGSLIHGDLTTSNILIKKGGLGNSGILDGIYFIDFGLASNSDVVEDKAVDLYVLEKAFICSHPDLEADFQIVLDNYKTHALNGEGVIRRLDKVRARGRKKIAFG